MRVSIVRPQDGPVDPVDVCVVVDVMRATTTAAVLCQRSDEVYVLRTQAELAQLPPSRYVLFSELSGIESEITRFDNSPVVARDAAIAGAAPVLVTTNGTVAVGCAAEFAREVVLGAFVNLSAIVAYIGRLEIRTIAVMPAGNIKQHAGCIEDDSCADAIVSQLSNVTTDLSVIIATCRADPRLVRRCANEPGLAADMDLCFSPDAVPVVPRVVRVDGAPWFLARRA